ncbi:hypothetical protein OQA88_7884 [Cercophora sp. LCS_1]
MTDIEGPQPLPVVTEGPLHDTSQPTTAEESQDVRISGYNLPALPDHRATATPLNHAELSRAYRGIGLHFLTTLVTIVATVAAAAVDTAAGLDKRTSQAAQVRVWGSGACDSSPIYNSAYTPGGCANIGGTGSFGARVNNPNQVCVFKFWQNAGCSGSATTWYINGAKDTGCFPLANQGGVFQLTSGARSFIANCAMDDTLPPGARHTNAVSDPDDRQYRYQALKGDAKIRLLKIEPGSAGEKVRASLIPDAFHEDFGCVTPQIDEFFDAEPSERNRGVDHTPWHTLIRKILVWIYYIFQRTLSLLHAKWFVRKTPKPISKTKQIPREVLKYEAVSWAWGDPRKNAEIEILDDLRDRWIFKVSQKLNEALKAVRSPNSVRTVWIDAVCIDQGNDFEKSHQVPMMDRIYGQAEESTTRMMRRDWFSRRWIIQEIALAKKAKVFCGSSSMDWVRFAQAIELFIEGESRMKLADHATLQHQSIPHYWKDVSALGAARLVREISAIRRLSPNTKSRRGRELLMSLEEIVCRLETFQTSKPHDTIYAYLVLAKDAVPIAHVGSEPTLLQAMPQAAKAFDMSKSSAKKFIVNYNEPYAYVWRQFIGFAISQQANRRRAPDVLCRPWAYEDSDTAKREALGLPRWVTTIGSAPFEMTTHDTGTIGLYRRNGDPFVGPPLKPIYNAADRAPVNDRILKFLSYKGMKGGPTVHSLVVTGFVLDKVKVIKDKVTSDALVLEEWLTLGNWPDKKPPLPEALWKTLVADRGPNGMSCPLSYPLCFESAIKLSQSGRNLEIPNITSHPDKYESFAAGFCSRVQEVVVNRRLIRTRYRNCLGLVSGREDIIGVDPNKTPGTRSIRVNDLICILHGCSVPVVLRKRKKTKEQMQHEDAEYQQHLKLAVKRVQRKWRFVQERRKEKGWRPGHTYRYLARRMRKLWTVVEQIGRFATMLWILIPYLTVLRAWIMRAAGWLTTPLSWGLKWLFWPILWVVSLPRTFLTYTFRWAWGWVLYMMAAARNRIPTIPAALSNASSSLFGSFSSSSSSSRPEMFLQPLVCSATQQSLLHDKPPDTVWSNFFPNGLAPHGSLQAVASALGVAFHMLWRPGPDYFPDEYDKRSRMFSSPLVGIETEGRVEAIEPSFSPAVSRSNSWGSNIDV